MSPQDLPEEPCSHLPALRVYGSTRPLATCIFWGAEPTSARTSHFTPRSGSVCRGRALCQRSAMLFTHERGAEASVPAANCPVLIFFGEKETRPFQTWPNSISWGRRGRAWEAFPQRARPREGAGMGRLGQLCLQAGTGGLGGSCAHPGGSAIPGSRVC